jgi:phage terminase small subunit
MGYKDLTPKKRKFIESYVLQGDVKQAALDAGYADNRAIMKRARNLRKELDGWIRQKHKEAWRDVELGIYARNNLMRLSKDADSEQVQLNATRELLDHNEPKEAQEVKVTHEHTHKQLTNDELDARIALLREKLWEEAPALEVVGD